MRILKRHRLTSIVIGLKMPKYLVLCPSCNSEFLSHEEYINHVLEKHADQPSVRMQANIIKKEMNET
jgi:uncharacterized C2H2 Zn-finger protein